MEAIHTKGPWTLCDEGDYGDYDGNCRVILGDVDGLPVRLAIVLTGGNGPMRAENEANAQLIWAAPDMLAALESIRDAGLGGYLTPELCAHFVTEAISKATSRQPEGER